MRTSPGRSCLAAAIFGLLLVVISSAAGATVAFSHGGGILVGVIVFTACYGFRRPALDRQKKPAW